VNTIIEDVGKELRCSYFEVFEKAVMRDIMQNQNPCKRIATAKEVAHRQHAAWLNCRTITQEVEDFALEVLRKVPKYMNKELVRG